MPKQLMLLEVSQKQAYIFGPRALKENQKRSAQIAHVTGSEFFKEVCPGGYSEEANLVYSGGGHTVLQFDSKEAAVSFSRIVTKKALERYPEMELFVKIMDFDETAEPGVCLNRLSGALEEKKSRRASSFRLFSLGIEKKDIEKKVETAGKDAGQEETEWCPEGWSLTYATDEIAGDDNFLAVVHIDGNGMGKRVQRIYEDCRSDWNKCVEKLKLFSGSIAEDFDQAYEEMAKELARALNEPGNERWKAQKLLPLRRIISAGDDLCFVTTGYFGLECAASFLEHLSRKINKADRLPYTACAGVVLIHTKFPFRRAYDLSDALCSNAKAFVAKRGGNISALDYHIEFGQMKDSLSQIRDDYRCDDGNYLELRPLAVAGEGIRNVPAERRYDFLTFLLEELQKNPDKWVRGKLKALRSAFRQGEIESRLAMRFTQTEDLLDLGSKKCGSKPEKGPFFTDGEGKRRCLYYDAIEIADNMQLWRKAKA